MSTNRAATEKRSVLTGIWRLSDPRLALSSFIAVSAGLVLAWSQTGRADFRMLALALITVAAIDVAKTAVSDLYDFYYSSARTVAPERRVITDGLLSESAVSWIACVAIVVAGVAGWSVAFASRPVLLLIGIAAVIASIEYGAPPLRLAHRALGEVLVFLIYGPGIVLASQVAFGGRATADSMVVAASLGLLVTAQILFNELADADNDEIAKRWTLPVLLGRESTHWLLSAVVFFAFTLPLLHVATGRSIFVAGLLAGAPFAIAAIWYLARTEDLPYARVLMGAAQVVAAIGLVLATLAAGEA